MNYFTRCLTGLVFLSVISFTASANRIDSLNTDEEVLAFLKSVNPDFNNPKFNSIELRDNNTLRKDLACGGVADSWQLNNWTKADLDGNGTTDLLVMLYWYDYGVYAVLDKNDGKFELHALSKNISDKCEMAKVISLNDKAHLLYYLNKKTDTLVFRHGGFVEAGRISTADEIDSVQFRTGYCFGSCPVFMIRFDKNGNAVYEAKTYNPKQGNFTGTLSNQNLVEIIDLINYAGLRNLNDNYSVSWSDDQTSWLRVKYKDGTVKEIKDYGMQGNFALRLIYSKFLALRTNQAWK